MINYLFYKYESSGDKLFSKCLMVDALSVAIAYFLLRKFAPGRSLYYG
ncbi:hypothetical protein COO91_00501 [Nostoc flagelliforme CCNUN1]|uniref:Uncharacterized protein n=1 Tax=Nostoc flagelliforme CCNUN1 TaxID=2038116 RepID=A0A2K8SGT1_9NOSO|nr:hypothetical protein COO91_00501 [Nostoc flagelliforme CCNUN1]